MHRCICCVLFCFFFSSRRRHTRCALVTGVQTCALPIYRMRGPLVPPGEEPVSVRGRVPKWQGVVAAMRALFEREWENIEAGLYRAPDGLVRPSEAVVASLRFCKDARAVDESSLWRRH